MSPHQLDVSFIIPSYQQRRYLEFALRSIREQGLSPGCFEVLVFDGGSSDGTRELLSNEPIVTYWEAMADRGQGHAVNKGLRMARGKIMAWLNSDDFYCPGALARVVQFFAQNPKVDVVYGKSCDVDEIGGFLREFPTREWSGKALFDSCFISQPATFFRRRFFERNGFLSEDLHLTLDYEYWLRAAAWARFEYVPEALACNRIHSAAKSSAYFLHQLKESARVSYEASGEWREAWLRRIASAQGRQLLGRWGLAETRLRVGLSALCYRRMQRKVGVGLPPFPLPVSEVP
jgi:glycosyltransferase involved in cell wall biosynthesis